MSKVTANYPEYSSSSVSIGGSKAKTGVINGVLSSNYDMSGAESDIYNYALNTLASILPQLNIFSADTQNSIQSQVDEYKNKGMQTINEVYTPLIKNLENNIASRFGNLDNSIFTDNLNDIESQRANAISSFAQDILAKQSQLESNELTKRYSLVELLSGLANNTYAKALDTINAAMGGSSNINSYNNDLYNALSSISNTNSNPNTNTNSLLSTLLSLSGSGSQSLLSLL